MHRTRFWLLGILTLVPTFVVAFTDRRLAGAGTGQDQRWVGVSVMDHGGEGGTSSYYMGELDRRTFDQLVNGEFKGFIQLQKACYLVDERRKVKALSGDTMFKGSIYFDSKLVSRLDPLNDAFVARAIEPALAQ